ncbi:hydroxyacid dehydrogenase [Dethiobacter alkaliphilus]|uniref:hydroxyacid dehydrogenase n=1 Tax=Dethiobacter alkaliphilus TaxID=427926 RepID=UPI002226AC57|nr:hydroxyacid dehydrogenase [Dethiobacter alkaliphilus]MCW3488790.1 hydroxyacid dehydrogenase [Dethiobacter alkaliphilus]
MANITFFETQTGDRPAFETALKDHSLSFTEEPLSDKNIADFSDSEIISVFIYSHATAELLSQLPNLKLILTRSSGFNHIDLNAAKDRNIPVCNVPVYGENTVAEHAFALILTLSRNIYKAYLRTQREDFSLKGLQGFDLKDKTLAVVGAGRIGLHVIKIARSFNMKVLAVDPTPDPFLAEVLQFSYAPLEEVLTRADIISLHAPLNEKTHHLLNKDNIPTIKKGALLINTARGELVETDALLAALNDGTIAGAGLDVLESEELFVEDEKLFSPHTPPETLTTVLKNHILLNREDVVITPHIGFNSKEAVQRIRETTVQNITAFLAGSPENVVKAP